MNPREAYRFLEGFIKGLKLPPDAKETEAFHAVLECLRVMSDRLEELEARCRKLFSYSETLDKDLGQLERKVLIQNPPPCPTCGETLELTQGEGERVLYCTRCEKPVTG